MKIKETKSYSMAFSTEESNLIDSLIREHVGSRTIESILDEYSYVISYYRSLLSLVSKIYYNIGSYVTFDNGELNVLVDLLSTAYNDGKHDSSREMIKGLCDAIDILRH